MIHHDGGDACGSKSRLETTKNKPLITKRQVDDLAQRFPSQVLRQMGDDFLGLLAATERNLAAVKSRLDSLPDAHVSFDYFSFTSTSRGRKEEPSAEPVLDRWQRTEKYLSEKVFPSDFEDLNRSMATGYDKTFLNAEGCQINYCKKKKTRPEHIQVVAKGESFNQLSKEQVWNFVRFPYMNGFNVTRVDVALDLFALPEGFSTPKDFLKHIDWCCETGRITGINSYSGAKSGTIGEEATPTVYLGSKAHSDYYVRCYDKALESGLYPIADGLGIDRLVWVRIEFVVRKDLANTLIETFVLGTHFSDFDAAIGKITKRLAARINFLTEPRLHNVDRNERQEWWEKIIDGAEKLKYKLPKKPTSIQKMQGNIHKQYGPTLCAIFLALTSNFSLPEDGFNKWIYEVIWDSYNRIKETQQIAINRYIRTGGSFLRDEFADPNITEQ